MKKQIALSVGLLTACVMFSGAASAAPAALPADGELTIATCSLLAEDVTITPSKNVTMGYNCVVASKAIRIGACHTGGRTSQRTELVPCDSDATTAAPECTVPPATVQTTGANIFIGSSNGGKVQPATYVDGDQCLSATVLGKIPD